MDDSFMLLDLDIECDDGAMEEIEKKKRIQEEIKNLKEDPEHIKRSWEFYNNVLGSPKHWCAPMVGASELAFRLMIRKYGTDIATTPMISAAGYIKSESYRQNYEFLSGNVDRPLIVQFWANNTESLLGATKLVEDHCDAVELNLGCPQQCARSGHYGAYLMNEQELLYDMVSTVAKNAKIPILCKVRIYKDYEKTLSYCKMLQNAGSTIITVHGRTREEKRSAETLADWNVIAKLKQDLQVPVISNGNVRNYQEDCFEQTKLME